MVDWIVEATHTHKLGRAFGIAMWARGPVQTLRVVEQRLGLLVHAAVAIFRLPLTFHKDTEYKLHLSSFECCCIVASLHEAHTHESPTSTA